MFVSPRSQTFFVRDVPVVYKMEAVVLLIRFKNMIKRFLKYVDGKTIDFAEVSSMHRTTTAYFLNHGKWDDSALQDILKARVIHTVYQEAYRSGKTIFMDEMTRLYLESKKYRRKW